jgi:hypothetical protein
MAFRFALARYFAYAKALSASAPSNCRKPTSKCLASRKHWRSWTAFSKTLISPMPGGFAPDARLRSSSSPPCCARTCCASARNCSPTFKSSNSFARKRSPPTTRLIANERFWKLYALSNAVSTSRNKRGASNRNRIRIICCNAGIVTVNRATESAYFAGMRPATLAAGLAASQLSARSPPVSLPVIR